MTRPLTPFQEAFVLSVCLKGTRILSARFHRAVQLPCPIWVHLMRPSGEEYRLIIRMDYSGGVEREAAILPLLAKLSVAPSCDGGLILKPSPGRDCMLQY